MRHKKDPSGGARLQTQDFYELTEHFVSLAGKIESCHGRLLSVLECGYDVEVRGGLQSSIEAHLRALARAPKRQKVVAAVGGKKRGREER